MAEEKLSSIEYKTLYTWETTFFILVCHWQFRMSSIDAIRPI